MKRKRLKKGRATAEVDEGGVPRDATGHRTDRPHRYDNLGNMLWRADELRFALGERVRAVQPNTTYQPFLRMSQGECETIMMIEEFVKRDYLVVPDRLLAQFVRTRSGEFMARMPEHFLEPE